MEFKILEKIRSNKDIKRLTSVQMAILADDIRKFLTESLAETGGHLASNLGVVELTLCLHAVFSTPNDKIVWDVGHQSYVHKILTGRKDGFATLRKQGGMSGFPKTAESEHDAFDTGHSSTSISAALGLAKARDMTGGKEKIIAVIGDGSMTGGLAYEGLNNAGRANTDILVVLNDNQMSISENVGAVSRHLNDIRTGRLYLGAKREVHQVLDSLPLIGVPLTRALETTKNALKNTILPGGMFQEMGFRYYGPVDGHNIPEILDTLRSLQKVRGPVLLHVMTKKGKGLPYAEKSPQNFHGVGKFEVETGESLERPSADSYTDVFSREICRLARRDSKIAAITAAMPDGTGLWRFKRQFPGRFYDVGIAEAHAVTFAAGLAKGGARPVVAVYSSFLQRAYDQIVHDVCLQNLPVVFAIDHAGAVGGDGETHQGLYDIAFLAHIPNMTILAPSNKAELKAMLAFALTHDGPVALRYPKASAPIIDTAPPVIMGKSEQIHAGRRIAIVGLGAMQEISKIIVDELHKKGYNPSLYDPRFIKPLDTELVRRLSRYEYVFTIEESAEIGGFGSLLAAEVCKLASPIFKIFAFPDKFIPQATRAEILKQHKLDAESISKAILNTPLPKLPLAGKKSQASVRFLTANS